MPLISTIASLAVIAAILALLFLLARWRVPSGTAGQVPAIMRFGPPVVFVALLAAALLWSFWFSGSEMDAKRSPEGNAGARYETTEAEPPDANPPKPEPKKAKPPQSQPPDAQPSQPKTDDGAASSGGAPPEPGDGAAAPVGGTRGLTPPPRKAAEAPPPAPSAPSAPSAPAPVPPQPAAEESNGKWSVVPVFFGTDRERIPGAKRLDYGAERGRRLDMGRALVSVPTAHEVPAIERPWELRIPYFDVKVYEEKEDPAKHFMMREIKTLTREELLALVAERLAKSRTFKDHALIFVHGFNTSFDNAVYRTAQIAHDLKFDGAPFLYSWPSGGAVASYTYDRESAGQSEPHMRAFMKLVLQDSKAKSVSVIAHSMGNQPVLQVLKDLKAAAPDIVISQIILAAPDVDRDNFENIAREIKGFAKGITLYAASNDRALGVSRRFNGGVPRAGDVPVSGPVVIDGVDTIDVTAVSTDSLALNHSSYAESNVLLNDIGLLLQTGERPPDRRIPILARVTTPRGDYWRYPGK